MRIVVAGGRGRLGRHVVDVLTENGHDAVAMSRSTGADVITGEGLETALKGADCLVESTSGPSPDRDEAEAFFTTAAANLRREAERAGVRRVVVVSIVGVDQLTTSYAAAKVAQEQAWLDGPIPVRILRAELFHEFVEPVTEWGRRGDVLYVPRMIRQPVAARAAAEALADLATADDAPDRREVAGPRTENVVDLAALLLARKGDPARVVGVSNADADSVLYEAGRVLAGPDAVVAGPSFAEWLEEQPR